MPSKDPHSTPIPSFEVGGPPLLVSLASLKCRVCLRTALVSSRSLLLDVFALLGLFDLFGTSRASDCTFFAHGISGEHAFASFALSGCSGLSRLVFPVCLVCPQRQIPGGCSVRQRQHVELPSHGQLHCVGLLGKPTGEVCPG